MLTDQQLAEIQARADRASPGPWYGHEDAGVYTGEIEKSGPRPYYSGHAIFETGCNCCTLPHLWADDAAFIAAAREDIPALLLHISEMKSIVK